MSCETVQGQSVCAGSTDHVQAASIHVTPSTNTPPVDVVVYCDASAERLLPDPTHDNGANLMVGLKKEAFRDFIVKDMAKLKGVVDKANIKLD